MSSEHMFKLKETLSPHSVLLFDIHQMDLSLAGREMS